MNDDDHLAKRPVRKVPLVLLICVLIGVVLLGLRLRAGYSAHHTTLPDGRTVEFLGTIVGVTPFSYQSKWHPVARYLPAQLQKWFPPPIRGVICGTSNSIAVHLGVKSSQAMGANVPWSTVATDDETGFRYPQNGGATYSLDSSGNLNYSVAMVAFPRRQKEFLVQLLDQTGAVMGTLRVANPLAGPFPEWKPAPFPQTQTNGPVTLTLKGFEEHVQGRWTNIEARWQLEANDPAWANGKTSHQSFLDASGNEGFKLSPHEPAWKVRTLVYRERPQDFAPNEQLVLTNVALPTAGNFTAIDQEADCAGVGIKVLVLASSGMFGISNGVTRFMRSPPQGATGHSVSSDGRNKIETWGNMTPFLLVEAQNVRPDDELKYNIRDDRGRELQEGMLSSESLVGQRRLYKGPFNPPPDAKFVTVQVRVSRPLTFEFLVDPKDVVTSAKMK
ncbi:MAG: hypothetical protein JWM16_1698 [Verrucomicrobiales bacterium]|nr:hypothetical protein [Verrucomicrobiales bacterium]